MTSPGDDTPDRLAKLVAELAGMERAYPPDSRSSPIEAYMRALAGRIATLKASLSYHPGGNETGGRNDG